MCSSNISEIQVKQNLEYWANRYKTGCFEWHIEQVHPHLQTYLPKLIEHRKRSDKNIKFFLPLCGKTKDIPFLLSLGFEVFGVEGLDSVIQEFIQENNLNLIYDPSRLLYYTPDEQLRIYSGDLFSCPIEQYGPFDCIWDRASFIAPDYSFRQAYLNVMKRSVAHGQTNKHDFRYLLQSVKYDKSAYNGPPRCVDATDIKELFASWANVTCLESNAVSRDHPCRQVCIKYYQGDFFEEFHLIQPKS